MNILEEIQNCPVEWKELGEVSHFYGGLTGKTKSDFENGNAKYVTYKNIFNNIQVELNILENVQVDENEKQNSIEYGDVLITGSSESKEEVGMSSVVTFVPEEPIYLNSFSFGIRFNEDVELLPEFTKYLFRSIEFRKQIEKTASGVTRYNISKVAFKKIKVPLLPQKIQEKIVQILDKFTDYVTELTSELTSRKKQYSFYRDKLLSFEDEVYQVEWKTLREVCDVRDGTHDSPNKKAFGKYLITSKNVKNGSINFDSAYFISESDFDNINKRSKVDIDDLLFTMIGTVGEVAHITEEPDFAIKNVGLFKTQSRILARYLLHYLQSTYAKDYILSNSSKGSQVFLGLGKLRNFPIPYVEPKIQSRIVQVLDNFDMVCNDLNIGLPKEIELRQKQYEYFREKLLTFVAEGEYTESRVEEWDNSAIIKLLQWVFGPIRVEFGAMAKIVRGASPRPISKFITESEQGVPWIKIGDVEKDSKYVSKTKERITQAGSEKSRLVHKGDFIMSNSMSFGRPYILNIDGCIHDGWLSMNGFDDVCLPDYLYHYLLTNTMQYMMRKNASNGTVQNLNADIVRQLVIVLPPLSIQSQIVSILDKFDILTNSLSEGLPKEIEQRQKQYEYWREQLLNFDL